MKNQPIQINSQPMLSACRSFAEAEKTFKAWKAELAEAAKTANAIGFACLSEAKTFGGYLTNLEAAAELSCSGEWIRRLINDGRLRASVTYPQVVSASDVAAYKANPPQKGRPWPSRLESRARNKAKVAKKSPRKARKKATASA